MEKVPETMLISITRKVWKGILTAEGHIQVGISAGDYTSEVAHDLLPIQRRACVESALCELQQEYTDVQVDAVGTKGNRNVHSLIKYENVSLTASCARNPLKLVRSAQFRKRYAMRATANVNLRQGRFEEAETGTLLVVEPDIESIRNGLIYGIILYGPYSSNPLRPSPVMIGFPDSQYREYIDLLKLGNPGGAAPSIKVEPVPDQATVRLLDHDESLVPKMEDGDK